MLEAESCMKKSDDTLAIWGNKRVRNNIFKLSISKKQRLYE